jgi:pyruvate formate lyase activating enzyme
VIGREETRGLVFDLREFTVHDGPGGRLTVFLKGCPLACTWCQNPEGQNPFPELMAKTNACTGCGNCRKEVNTEDYRLFGRSPSRCPAGLLRVSGEWYTAEALLDRILPLKEMLEMTEGGVTFSGGEPLMQSEFLAVMLDLLREHGIHTAIETSGYADAATFREIVLRRCDYVMMDLKLMRKDLHEAYTGVDNTLILENARALRESGVPHVFRTPMIPGITDTEENLAAILAFVGNSPHEKIPYNAAAGSKYPMLGREYDYKTPITPT